jgi:hypothetical protein
MGMYLRGMWEGMSTCPDGTQSQRENGIRMELIAGIAEHTYKPTLPTRFPTGDILTTPTIRRSLSAIN